MIVAAAIVLIWSGQAKKIITYYHAAESGNENATSTQKTYVTIGSATLIVDVADTFEARAQGLSNTQSLPLDRGMLFSFEQDKQWGIWMKDMRYPLDILWLDASSTIIDVKKSADPKNYPETYFPKRNARYVLETNAGFFDQTGAKIGDIVKIFKN